ncbi:MAG: hypothetical protein ABEL76_02235, partial [Bradymonadaceae bacterium]
MASPLRRCIVAAVIAGLCSSGTAAAQPGTSPTDGLDLPDRSIPTQSDASALEVNPAGLAFLGRAELEYALELDALDRPPVRDGHALFGAAGSDRVAAG